MKQKIKLLTCLISAIFSVSGIQAQKQSASNALEQINNIKLNDNYIWAEGTSAKNKKDALENAKAVLELEIKNWSQKSGQKHLSAKDVTSNNLYMKIETERRKVYRIFLYVAKNEIVQTENNEKVVVVEHLEKKSKKVNKEPELISAVEEIYTPTNFEKDMLTVKLSSEMETFINDHKISTIGKYKDRPQSGKYYIFIFNKEGKVPASLKVTDGKIINVATGKTDSFENYKGCGGLWFIQKN